MRAIENKIDEAFSTNPLLKVNSIQAVWTLMSVLEDIFFKIRYIDKSRQTYIEIWTDTMINSISHPLRLLFSTDTRTKFPLKKELIDEQYGWAYNWLKEAHIYNEFCTIFSLYHKGCTKVSVEDRYLNVIRDAGEQFEYEAYNRIRIKEGNEKGDSINNEKIIELIKPYVKIEKDRFEIDLKTALVTELVAVCSIFFSKRFKLPSGWRTTGFSFESFRKVFETIQAILIGRLYVRDALAFNGLPNLGYTSIIWTIPKKELVFLLAENTNICNDEITNIIDILTFGNKNIRNPDIATQPIIDLANEYLALSPFIWINLDGERNLCVLLNKVKEEQKLYSKLVREKESVMKNEIIEFIRKNEFNYDIRSGNLGSTDLDIAIIDRQNKVCICIELKWFIEPAEVEEIVNRSKELSKGVQKQSKEILRLFKNNDDKLLNVVLDIDKSYDFFVLVGSRNWIGNHDVQDNDVPIIKIFHLLEKLKELRSLSELKSWLINRSYLPEEGNDYEIIYSDIEIGNWKSKTYGINILKEV